MDTEEQVYGLIGAAQEHQRAMTSELAALIRATTALQEASAQAVPAVEKAAGQGVAKALSTASVDATAALMATTKHLVDSLWKGVHATDQAEFKLSKAAQLFDRSVVAMRWRHVAMLSAGAAGCIVAVLIAGWISLTWQRSQVNDMRDERAALLVEVAGLRATVDKLTAKGGAATLNTCGPQKGRVCVRVDAGAGTYGDKNTGQYYVVHGY